MAHKTAALKYIRQTKKRTARNESARRHIGYLRKKASKALAKKDIVTSEQTYRALAKSVDKAAKRNLIKKNTAARRKSRLAKKLNALKKSS